MKTKLLIWIIVSVLLVSFVSATHLNYNYDFYGPGYNARISGYDGFYGTHSFGLGYRNYPSYIFRASPDYGYSNHYPSDYGDYSGYQRIYPYYPPYYYRQMFWGQ